jgi:hypothetical protein
MMAQSLRVPFDGTDLGDRKSQAPGLCNTFLGVEHDFRPFAASRFSLASVDATCIRDIAGVLQEVLDASSLDAVDGGVPKLCGRLHFTLSWGCRRFGRAAMQPLHAAASAKGAPTLSPSLRAALTFLRDILVDPSSKEVRLRPRRFDYRRAALPTVLIWSDARWERTDSSPAGIGFVVFFPATTEAQRAAATARTPPWLGGAETPPGEWLFAAYDLRPDEYSHWRERSQYIGQLELLAAIAVYYSLAQRLRGRRVIHAVDNTGAMACLINDYSTDVDSAALVHSFWALAVALDVDVWFVFVNSAANIADWPSRGLVAFAADLGASRVEGSDLRLPPREMWGSVDAAVAAAGVSAPPLRSRSRAKRSAPSDVSGASSKAPRA